MDTLPVELLVRVIEELWEEMPGTPLQCTISPLDRDPLLQNLKSVRLVSKAFRSAAFKLFRDTYFTKLWTTMDKKSLTKLVDVTASNLGAKLERLLISTYQFLPHICESKAVFEKRVRREKKEEHTYLKRIGEEFDAKRIVVAYKSYKHYLKEQQYMRNTGGDSAMLARALGNARKSLKCITISGLEPSQGSRAIVRDVGVTLSFNELPDSTANAVISVVLRALYWSRIELCQLDFTCLRVGALKLSDEDFYHLKKSNIHLHVLDFAIRGGGRGDEQNLLRDGLLADLIKTAPHVNSLGLRFPEFQTRVLPLRVVIGTRFNALMNLDLEGLTVRRNDLLFTLHKLRYTLEAISFRQMFLRTGTWRGIFKWMHANVAPVELSFHNIWDTEEEFHIPSASLKDYMNKDIDEFDWDEMSDHIKQTDYLSLEDVSDSDSMTLDSDEEYEEDDDDSEEDDRSDTGDSMNSE